MKKNKKCVHFCKEILDKRCPGGQLSVKASTDNLQLQVLTVQLDGKTVAAAHFLSRDKSVTEVD